MMLIGRRCQSGDKLGQAQENNPTQNGLLALFGIPPVPLDLHPTGAEVHRCADRFRVLVAGRRFGKSRLAETELMEQALCKPGSWLLIKNERALQLTLINGSVIQLAGAEITPIRCVEPRPI
jgi:hypothetical protein